MSLLRLDLIIDGAVIFILSKVVSSSFSPVLEMWLESWVKDGKSLVVFDRPTIVSAVLVLFLSAFAVDTEANVRHQDFAASWCRILVDIPNGTLLPADIVMHIKNVVAFSHCAEAVSTPLVIVFGL